jgi:hypothetical protein
MAFPTTPKMKEPKGATSSLSDYDHTDQLTTTSLIAETITNNCTWGNAKAVALFSLGILFIYYASSSMLPEGPPGPPPK